VWERLRRLDSDPRAIRLIKAARARLPGDPAFGDPLSIGGPRAWQLFGRRLAEVTGRRPGLLHEAGLGALQVWEHVAEAQGRGRGTTELAIVFTDLVDFSAWALDAGDDAALALLRDVGCAIEPPVHERGGEVVKRLGDGMMAVFDDPATALDAVLDGMRALEGVRAPGYEPVLRAGLHWGRPRRLGGDYLGVDVNVAARMAEGAAGNEVLVSDRALELLDRDRLDVRRKWRFKVKGVPKDLTTYCVSRAT
jgi:adenylate cyclase